MKKHLLLFLAIVASQLTLFATDYYIRGAHNSWAANAADQLVETETSGVYTISNYTLSGQFKIADASWSTTANYGANTTSALVTPGVVYKMLANSNPGNMTVAESLTCSLITFNTNDSTLLIEAAPIPEPTAAGNVLWPSYARILGDMPSSVRVLSMNNSLIHYENEWQDAMFNSLAAAEDKDAHWTAHTNLGKSLKYHYNEGEGYIEGTTTPSARMLVRTEAWTHIILQEQTAKPRTDFVEFRESIRSWVEYIRANCPNPYAVIILPINWPYNTDPFTEFSATFLANYHKVAQEFGLVLCPIGPAYLNAYEQDPSILQKWFKDDRHPRQNATYLGCLLEYATIYDVDPATITWQPTTLTESEGTTIRQYASQTWQNFEQVVDQHNDIVHFEMHELDEQGLSIRMLESAGKASFNASALYEYLYENETYHATIEVGEAINEVPELPVIAFGGETTEYTENFNALGVVPRSTDDAKGMKYTSHLPEGWRIERNLTGPREVGTYSAATDTTMYMGGVSLASNAYNGTWNWGADDDTDRAIGGLTTGVANGTRGINIMVHMTNSGTETIQQLVLSYDIEKYRSGNNAAGFSVTLYRSANGNVWTPVGEEFISTYPADNATEGATTVPIAVTHVSDTLLTDWAPATDLYLAWNISVSSGDNCAGAPGYALDNVLLKAVEESASDIESITASHQAVNKFIHNGQLYIRRGEAIYSPLGTKLH